MASTSQTPEMLSVIATIKTLTNAQLKDILRNEGLAVSGVKSALQLRIIDYIERLNQAGHLDRFDRLRALIHATGQRALPPPSPSTHTRTQPPAAQHYHYPYATHQALPSPSPYRSQAAGIQMPSHPFTTGRLGFKESPFYTILEPLTPTVECKIRESTRDSVELKVNFSNDVASRLQEDPNLRVMVFCAADSGINQFSRSDVAFPQQVELKVNLDEIKSNLMKGLKNRPGTTRPVDVTNYMRKKPGYSNHIVMTYALTQKKYFLLVNLVKRHPVEDLVARLKTGKIITKEQVKREMLNRASDSDIVATSSIMSLKCPLSQVRIVDPCRSSVCTHNQCFDATPFLQLQEQAPTWTCPVCSKATSFESLLIDQYFKEILTSTPRNVDQVVIEPDGSWHSPEEPGTATLGGVTPATDDEDDVIEIKEPGAASVKREPVPLSLLGLQQTPAQSREASTTSSAAPFSGRKRPAAEVIDLTLSDDDDSPARPARRRALSGAVSANSRHAYNGTSNGSLASRGSFQFGSQPSSETPSQNGW